MALLGLRPLDSGENYLQVSPVTHSLKVKHSYETFPKPKGRKVQTQLA